MANYFDQFDAPMAAPQAPPKKNYFDQFDAPQQTQQQQSKPATFGDVAKSFVTGAAQGATSLGGMAMDAMNFVEGDPRNVYNAVNGGKTNFPSNESLLNSVVSAPSGGYHQPQSVAGQYAQTAGQFVPNAFGGEASIPLRLARIIGPAVASETAGQATAGTPYEGAARLAAALVGTAPTAIAETAAGKVASTVPSVEDLKSAANDAYAKVDNSGMMIGQPSVKALADATQSQLANLGIDKTLNPNAFAVLTRLQSDAENNHTLQGMEVLRRVAQNGVRAAVRSGSDQDVMMSNLIKRNIDSFVTGLGPQDVIGNVDQDAINALGIARNLWARASKSEDLEDLVDTAKLRSMMSQATSEGQAIRGKFGQLAQNQGAMAGFSPEEQAAIQKVAIGTPAERLARLIGKLSPDHALPLMAGLMEGGNALFEGDLGKAGATVGVLGAGAVGKLTSNAITARNARLAAELVRRGASGTAQSLPPQLATTSLSPLARQGFVAGWLSQPNQYGGSQ